MFFFGFDNFENLRQTSVLENQLKIMEQRITDSAARIAELESLKPNGDHDSIRPNPKRSKTSPQKRKSSLKVKNVKKARKTTTTESSSEYELDLDWSKNDRADNTANRHTKSDLTKRSSMIQGASREQKLTTDNETLNGKIYTDYESKGNQRSTLERKNNPYFVYSKSDKLQ